MVTSLKTILIILLVYYGIKILVKWLTPYFLRYLTRKVGKKFEQSFGANPYQNAKKQKVGEVTIDKGPSKNKKSKSTVGEYVDYEEID